MTDILMDLTRRIRAEAGFVIGRVALVMVILALIIVFGLIAFIVPGE
jgi:hypothetical protein